MQRLTYFTPPAISDRAYSMALKVAAWLLILTHGEPDILGAVVGLIGRVAA